MRRTALLIGAVGAILPALACQASAPGPPPAAASEYHLTTTVKDIMDSMVDPNADVLWDAVAIISTREGVQYKQPRTNDEWQQVRRSAVMLLEAMNLVVLPGRQVAKPGERATEPSVELSPEEIQKLIDSDRASWAMLAHGLHDEATKALAAIDSRDAMGLMTQGEKIDQACENCHLKYWYPNDKQVGQQ
jgi:hypothetical protein